MRAWISGVLLLAFAGPAFAQVGDKPFVEGEKRAALEPDAGPPPPDQPFLYDWGGWLSAQYLSLGDEPIKDYRQQRYWDLRVWGMATFSPQYRAYARLRNTYQDWNSGDQFNIDKEKTALLRLDQGYVEGFWGDLHARVGRQGATMGSGLLLNGVYDGVQLDGSSGALRFKVFGVHTIVNEDDIDRSRPDPDHSRRAFIGAEAEYSGLGPVRPSLMLLVERDLNNENDPFQDYAYDAWYAGLGLRGSVLAPGLFYRVEFDYEGGTSSAASGTETEAISAFALVASVDYHAPWATSPRFGLTYVRATGDADRGNPTDASSGNLAGSNDEGFLAFGYLQSGFSLFPRISNLHVFKLEASFKPFESYELTKSFEVALAVYKYEKDESAEQISDPRSFNNSTDVGTEIDLSLRWRMVSDAGLALDFGRFQPGDAYVETANRDFFALSITYSF